MVQELTRLKAYINKTMSELEKEYSSTKQSLNTTQGELTEASENKGVTDFRPLTWRFSFCFSSQPGRLLRVSLQRYYF